MFVVLSSWHSHCESSPGSFDECRLSAGWPPTLRPNNRFGLWVRRKIGCYYPQTPSSIQGVYSRKSRRKTQYLLKFRIWALQWLIMVIMADGPLIRHIMSTRWPVNKKTILIIIIMQYIFSTESRWVGTRIFYQQRQQCVLASVSHAIILLWSKFTKQIRHVAGRSILRSLCSSATDGRRRRSAVHNAGWGRMTNFRVRVKPRGEGAGEGQLAKSVNCAVGST